MKKLVPLVIILVVLIWASQQKIVEKPKEAVVTTTKAREISKLFLVTRVIDGDTIEVQTSQGLERVRYIGIDTPEMNDKRPEIRELATKARQKNEELVLGKKVKLEKDISEKDYFRRLLRYVYLEDGTFVNLELVKQGFAKMATFQPDVRHSADFLLAEQTARQKGLGLWAK